MRRKPAVDPYTALGVPKDADAPTIKRAYRRKAKVAHPDVGGSADDFAALAAAHALLIDPVKRLEYDRTGTVEDGPSQVDTIAMNMIAGMLDKAMQQEATSWPNDLVAAMRGELKNGKETAQKQIAQVKRQIVRAERLAAKFLAKKGANLLRQMAQARIAEMHGVVANGESHLASIDRAVEMLRHQAFDADPVPKRTAADAYQLMSFRIT